VATRWQRKPQDSTGPDRTRFGRIVTKPAVHRTPPERRIGLRNRRSQVRILSGASRKPSLGRVFSCPNLGDPKDFAPNLPQGNGDSPDPVSRSRTTRSSSRGRRVPPLRRTKPLLQERPHELSRGRGPCQASESGRTAALAAIRPARGSRLAARGSRHSDSRGSKARW
jgi:hypothetical protein